MKADYREAGDVLNICVGNKGNGKSLFLAYSGSFIVFTDLEPANKAIMDNYPKYENVRFVYSIPFEDFVNIVVSEIISLGNKIEYNTDIVLEQLKDIFDMYFSETELDEVKKYIIETVYRYFDIWVYINKPGPARETKSPDCSWQRILKKVRKHGTLYTEINNGESQD